MTEQGLSLADIGQRHEDVPIGASFIRVYGISAEDILSLLQRYPDALVKALNGASGGQFKDIVKTAPQVVSAILAAAVGKIGDAKAEAEARRVPIEYQLDILEAVGRLSFKNGFGPFVKRILDGLDQAGFVNSGKAPGMKSPQASNTSSPTDTLQTQSGS